MATVVQLSKSRKSPGRKANIEYRKREYLLSDEVDRMVKSARSHGRHGHRDSALVLLAFRHALRISELVNLTWDQIDLSNGTIHVHRFKNGIPSVHPLRGVELRALRRLKRDYPDTQFVFVTERNGPMTPDAARKVIVRAGKLAELEFPIHPHMLRHATGYYLASKGYDTRAIQAYMGHRNIQNTVRYTELSPNRFKGFWQD